MRVSFIGLGVMGYPMAGYLAKSGHEVVVYNRTTTKAEKWCEEFGGSSAATPAAAAQGADIVFSCVGNDDDVRDVILGDDGAICGMSSGSIVVDHTTASATLAREIHGIAAEKSIGFLDAPLSGGQAGAENGQLTIMVGGDEEVFDRAAPVMDCYAKAITLIGPVGSGSWRRWLIKSASRAWSRDWPKACTLPVEQDSILPGSLRLSRKAQRNPGKWKIVGKR